MKLVAVLSTALLVCAASWAQKVRVKVDNEIVAFETMPRQINGITMVPLRTMMDSMQGSMRWDLATKTVSAWKNSRRFDFVLNSRDAMVNDKPMRMDEAPIIIKNRIFVPLKFVADASGYVISMEDGWYVLRPTIKQ
jgi:hypothetical protein